MPRLVQRDCVFGTSGGSSDRVRAASSAVLVMVTTAAAGEGGKVEVGDEDARDDRGDGFSPPACPPVPTPSSSASHVLEEEEKR